MFDTTGLKSGDKFQVRFVTNPKDAYVRNIVWQLGPRANEPVNAVFYAAGEQTKTGYRAMRDTVNVQIGEALWGGLWPHEDGADYSLA